jgi:tRNA G18 (ribose-2'-O)-methylase SpoU
MTIEPPATPSDGAADGVDIDLADPMRSLPPLSTEDATAYRDGLAIRATAASGEPGWIEACVDMALNAKHAFPRGEARIALQLAPAESVVAALLPALTSANRRLRRRSMTLLPRLDPDEVVRQMTAWLPSATKEGKRAACVALAAVGAPATALLELLSSDAETAVQRRATRALQVIADRASQRVEESERESSQRPFGLRPPRDGMPPRARSFAVAAFNFSYGVNLGVLIRSAEAAGAEAVWIVGRDYYYRPSTKGTDWWLPIALVESPAACIAKAHEEGFSIVALQQGPEAVPLHDVAWPERPLIVVGNEGDGLPAAFVAAADLQVTIPLHGRIDSLNVSVAASVAMYGYLGSRAARARDA